MRTTSNGISFFSSRSFWLFNWGSNHAPSYFMAHLPVLIVFAPDVSAGLGANLPCGRSYEVAVMRSTISFVANCAFVGSMMLSNSRLPVPTIQPMSRYQLPFTWYPNRPLPESVSFLAVSMNWSKVQSSFG